MSASLQLPLFERPVLHVQCADLSQLRVPLHPADALRSADNIARWNAYLPGECVRMMVRLGWDLST